MQSLKQTAHTREIAVLMLTAKGEEVDRIVGFELGADDYVVKPFSVRELLLRIDAILRRLKGEHSPDAPVEFGNLRIDRAAHRVWVGESEVELTALEFKLLLTLFARKNRVQSRAALLDDVWGVVADVTTRTVDTHSGSRIASPAAAIPPPPAPRLPLRRRDSRVGAAIAHLRDRVGGVSRDRSCSSGLHRPVPPRPRAARRRHDFWMTRWTRE